MLDGLTEWLFDSSGLSAHGFCLLWEPWLIWAYALSDCLIGLAYFSIPIALVVIAQRRRDLIWRPLLWLFAVFILLCGTTHCLDVITLWVPAYNLEALVKIATAAISIFTAFMLWKLLPDALVLPSPAQYREASAALVASQVQLIQAQKMEAVGQLTGGIAHDFNNLLQAITSSLSLVERRIASGRIGEVGQYISVMRHAADSAAGLTNRLLAFSRRQALQPREIELAELITGMEELVRRTLGPAIQLELLLAKCDWTVECDPSQLESALLNLAINARDAMPAGGTLKVALSDRNLTDKNIPEGDEVKPGQYVEIVISDTGQGMPPDILAHAFEPFFTTKPLGQGTGLGLSQVYGFVKQSRGTIWLESQSHLGTTVRLFLPVFKKRSIKMAETPPAEASAPRTDGQTVLGKILVVEDQTNVRAQIVEVLEDIGCTLVQASDGPSGLSIVQSGESFDLLIADVGLPGLNGRQLADAARFLNPDLPVLFITGYVGAALDTWQLPEGMALMQKPFSLNSLIKHVQEVFNNKWQGTENNPAEKTYS